MAQRYLSSDLSSCQSRPPAEPEFGLSTVAGLDRDGSPAINLRQAIQVLTEHDLALPERDQLNLIATSASAAQALFFTACLHDPDKTELHLVFEMFVMACVTRFQETETI
jgi:hypothetical protein